MPVKTKFELKAGMATREAFGKALVELGARESRYLWRWMPTFRSRP